MRPLIYIMTPVLILTILLASRFVTWDAIKGENPQAQEYVQKGTLLLRTWKIPQAIVAFTQAVEIEPRYAEAYVKRGLAYHRAGNYKTAIADYTRTLELKRYQADAYASRGDAYRALDDAQRAIADYTASLKKRWSPRVMRKRAQTYLEDGNAQNALADYDTVIKRQPSAVTYYSRGNTHFQLFTQGHKDRLKLALADMDRAIALEPRFARAYMSRGLIHEHARAYTSATADYTHALELLTETIQTWQGDPNALIQAHYWRALIYQKLGEVAKVEKEIHEANRRIFSFFVEKLQKM
ncbi:hypothetical protein C6496_11330 [Candidatus Poribacteria bacterium]|nr:MAG: hypothetical protein C6496_11330 [Candidatus Poribacteria bacterium]